MNKEIHYEGWLIKSPPTKRIWRARWRRRWFTLKQGEIPEQFCLEYYTDRNCRKLKGVIDLDQCEQVDCGLRLENRKQKFQHMFDIKTPRRTYYLAADTESDMRDWVNCICQVCHLHDVKQSNEKQDDKAAIVDNSAEQYNPVVDTSCAIITSSGPQHALPMTQKPITSSEMLRHFVGKDNSYVNTTYSVRDKFVNESSSSLQNNNSEASIAKPASKNLETARLAVNSQGVVRKIPDNLVLNSTTLSENSVEYSPALSTSSGPYIPISECFSGSPKFISEGNPLTPLNNLDPKFYDTPRSHNNIGLNLTNDQSYSPKITNCVLQTLTKVRSGRSSPTDSESVFTDDDEWSHPSPLRENIDRSTRPSDSSVENEVLEFTYSQRFSKLPGDNKDDGDVDHKNESLTLDITKEDEKVLKDISQLSDTENTSPAIGPKNALSYVDESYDIPRSHNLPYYNMAQFDKASTPENLIAASTPNLLTDTESVSTTGSNRTLPRPHCYTNAAPIKMEGNVFRYDFVEQTGVPPVNRKLKPKINVEDKPPEEMPAKPPTINNEQDIVGSLAKRLVTTTVHNRENTSQQPPSIDRKTKPSAFKQTFGLSSPGYNVRRSGIPTIPFSQNENNSYLTETRTLPRQPRSHAYNIYNNTMSAAISLNKETSSSQKEEHKLQYFDLDVSNPPPINRGSMSTSNLVATGSKQTVPADPTTRAPVVSGVVYNLVDFVKTDAFKKIREERKNGIKKL